MTTPTQAVTPPAAPAQSPQDRIASLKEQQAALELALYKESERPFPQLSAFDDLNRQKIQIRDEIHELERQSHPAALSWRGSGSVNMTGRPRPRVRGQQHRRP